MASTLCSGLGLDNSDISNKLLLISEENQSDLSFLITTFIWKGVVRTDEKIQTNACLLSFHNTQEHYENIAVKLGFNLVNYIKKGSVVFLDGLKYINDYFNSAQNKDVNETVSNEFCKNLFFMIRNNVESLHQSNRNNVYLLIDDVSDLLLAGFTLRSVLIFIKYCRTLLSDNGVTLTIGTYLGENDVELFVLYKNLFCAADYCISVSGLKTGFSVDVTGSISIVEKVVNEIGFNQCQRDHYHFKFNDRQVKVFSPGSIQ